MSKSGAPDLTENLARLHTFIGRELAPEIPGCPERAIVLKFLAEVSRNARAKLAKKYGNDPEATVNDWLAPDAIESVLAEKITKYNPAKHEFRPWCVTVVHNHVVDEVRHLKRDALGHTSTGKGRDEEHDFLHETKDTHAEMTRGEEGLSLIMEQVRGLCDLVANQPKSKIDDCEVLLVQIRWVVSERIRKGQSQWELEGLGKRSEIVEFLLPWTEEESQRRFQEGWPRIAEIWEAMALVMEQTERALSFTQFQELLESRYPDAVDLRATSGTSGSGGPRKRYKASLDPEIGISALGVCCLTGRPRIGASRGRKGLFMANEPEAPTQLVLGAMPHPSRPNVSVSVFGDWALAVQHIHDHLLIEPELSAWLLVIPELRNSWS